MKRLAIIGSGDLGKQIAYHAEADGHYQVSGFFDDAFIKGNLINGFPILGGLGDVETCFNELGFDFLMIGLGYTRFDLRAGLFEKFAETIPFGTIIHSSSFVDSSCSIGAGVIIYPGCTLDMNVEIAENVLINVGCVIAHDTTIQRHTFLSPAVNIAGFVNVGSKVNLGINSVLIDNIRIDDGIRVGAGAVVTKSLTNKGLYVGIPASFKKL